MRLIILFIILFIFSNKAVVAQDAIEKDSLLLWRANRKLTWNDFKGLQKNDPVNEVANIKAGISATIKNWNGDIPEFQVCTYMRKYNSWSTVTDSLSLLHEQGHFDIYELHTRKIRKAYDSLNIEKVSNIEAYEKIYKNYMKECKNTNHSYEYSNFNEDKQQEWIDKIAKELEELKEYEYKLKE